MDFSLDFSNVLSVRGQLRLRIKVVQDETLQTLHDLLLKAISNGVFTPEQDNKKTTKKI